MGIVEKWFFFSFTLTKATMMRQAKLNRRFKSTAALLMIGLAFDSSTMLSRSDWLMVSDTEHV